MSYAKAKQQYEEKAAHQQPEDTMDCMWCHKPTKVSALNTYGARCFECYERYCAGKQPVPSIMADKRVEGDKAWADALRKREMSCQRLSQAQRDMWRSCRGKS